ncbi:hypothetical protein KP509_16G008200 [Ceratopteris richardii]|uniref:Mitochondrial import inner membrane translocase subunit Tim16 n=1 Tax=Ceratopteris richardii TaxID=49495 RepID=A0A8T2SYI4_CERRI|nr:hypothetical protein KP509_16G008200 [Ceratopteris richardii]
MAATAFRTVIMSRSGLRFRFFSQAYRQNASKLEWSEGTVRRMISYNKTMTEEEARMILGTSENTTVEEMLQKYDNLFQRNAKSGSFYLQSKVQRA